MAKKEEGTPKGDKVVNTNPGGKKAKETKSNTGGPKTPKTPKPPKA